ncbi:MAG TPA: Zn-ribbon domain-containing OB-fold protein [Burkholderiaceae bacterium]|nr:Zn-ribbon domain-containing OB-fold protein [Burkholderiaceae bacterium]
MNDVPSTRPRPVPTPETAHFWEGTRAGRLLLQRCEPCGRCYFPPRPFCPRCHGSEVTVVDATGRASLYSYVVSHLPAPGFEPPYVIAVVQLDEGPRMMTNLVGVEPDPARLRLDQRLTVVYQDIGGGISLPLFTPEADHV